MRYLKLLRFIKSGLIQLYHDAKTYHHTFDVLGAPRSIPFLGQDKFYMRRVRYAGQRYRGLPFD